MPDSCFHDNVTLFINLQTNFEHAMNQFCPGGQSWTIVDNRGQFPALSLSPPGVSLELVKAKILLPIALMIVFALSRYPKLLPWNFSATYALMFCAGVYFPKRLAWCLPFATMLVTDVLLNVFYYHVTPFAPEMIGNYLVYAALVWLGRCFSPKSPFLGLLGGGILGAILFYLVTNTFSWLHDPAYPKNLQGWFIALTSGRGGYPQTWEFFRNTMMSGGLFTGLFAGTMKLTEAAEPEEKEEPAEDQPEEQPEEAKA